MYLGPIAIARYHNVTKQTDILVCPNEGCKTWAGLLVSVANAPYCGNCGTKKEYRPLGKKSVPLATPIKRPGLVYYQDGYYCHYYTLSGADCAALERESGFDLYSDDGLTELPSAIHFTLALEQMRANHHQALIDAGYDSVKYVFGLLTPEAV